jgi:hypothetical protein
MPEFTRAYRAHAAMTKIYRHINNLVLPIWFALLLLGVANPLFAAEAAVDPGDNGADVIEDMTEDPDSRSSEVSASTEDLVDLENMHDSSIPLAEAVKLHRWSYWAKK